MLNIKHCQWLIGLVGTNAFMQIWAACNYWNVRQSRVIHISVTHDGTSFLSFVYNRENYSSLFISASDKCLILNFDFNYFHLHFTRSSVALRGRVGHNIVLWRIIKMLLKILISCSSKPIPPASLIYQSHYFTMLCGVHQINEVKMNGRRLEGESSGG